MSKIRVFFGPLNHYGHSIINLAKNIHSDHYLLRKKGHGNCFVHIRAFQWGHNKLSFTLASVLGNHYPSISIENATDASSCAIGSLLLNVLNNGSKHPIAFTSITLSPNEHKHPQIEKGL